MKDAVYQVITDRVITLLEQGTVPWHKPWRGGDMLPQNLISRKPYRGVNVFMLHAMAYESPFWLTFKQAKEMGGNVRKGEHACPVVFWKWLGADETGEATAKRPVPMLRYYSVFNVAQCDGVTAPAVEGTDRAHSPIETAEQIVAAMPQRPVIRHGLDRAFYSPAADSVGMPSPERFETPENYYNVLFHELTHSTGHESRLNRKRVAGVGEERAGFGSQSYSKEELVAEMGAAFLCGRAGRLHPWPAVRRGRKRGGPMNTRTLKIEATGDFWRGKVRPKIRLTGRWLERAGFPPGERVTVEVTGAGCLTLRAVAPQQ